MTGTSATTFNPKGVTTRAMVVATLYRLAGSPEVTEKAAFTDVVSGSYYEAAVAWAARNAIASGTSETTFEPNKAVTREQLAKFLFNYAVYQGMDAVTLAENLSSFSDQADISAYAVSALQWAVGAELHQGLRRQAPARRHRHPLPVRRHPEPLRSDPEERLIPYMHSKPAAQAAGFFQAEAGAPSLPL